jgi:hypothetical protein
MRSKQKILVIASVLMAMHGFSQQKNTDNEFSFMFYNTENFFDCENDSLSNDEEFTPQADRRWNESRMHSKAERIGKVILAAGKWNPPAFVGLCEIENLNVLELLANLAPLNNYGYKIIHKDSPDERGIDVALIYRPEVFHPIHYQTIPVVDPTDKEFRTRDILMVSGVLNGCDTLHIFINHWPSRYGGIMETQKYRVLAAEILKENIRKLKDACKNPKIICVGDFNDSPGDDSLKKHLGAIESNNPDVLGDLVNLSFPWLLKSVKTIKSQYTWEVFDQWIVSDYFLEKTACYNFSRAEIFDADFLLMPDSKFGGVKPRRTYTGFKYEGGFSDHLPILLRFTLPVH